MLKRYRSQGAIKKRNKRLIVRGAIVLGTIAFFLGGGAYFSRLQSLQIDAVSIKGLATLSEEQIKTIFDTQIAGTYAFLFPKKNILLYPKDDIAEEINATYKQIETIDISLSGMKSVDVTVKERQPFALWCKEVKEASDCYFLDRKGYVYTKAPYFSGNTFIKYYGKLEGEPLGAQFADETKINEITKLILDLRKHNLEIIGFQIENKDDYTAYLKDGGKLLFNDTTTFDILVQNIVTVFDQNGIKKEDIPKLDYINLRFEKKVFFKLKGE